MKFLVRSISVVLLFLLFFVSCSKDDTIAKDGNFKPEDFKATTLKIAYSYDGYNVEYKIENLKDQPYKKSYGYQVIIWVGDADNKYGHGIQFAMPDIPAKGTIQGKEGIGAEKYADPIVTYQIAIDP